MAEITPQYALDIETRLDELAQLKDGWLDGQGRALDRESLSRLAQLFKEHFDGNLLPLPHLYPRPEDGIQAEWTIGEWEVSLEITLPSLACEYQAVHSHTGETHEMTILLANDDDIGNGWIVLNDELTRLQK